MKKIFLSALSLVFFLGSSVSMADWALDAKNSSLSFVSVKNTAIVEVHEFTTLSGSVDEQGSAILNVDMKSVETRIPIRNERMENMLFDTNSFPSAQVQMKLDAETIATLANSSGSSMEVRADLTLKNQTKRISANLIVAATVGGGVTVSTTQPILLYATEWGLLPGIDALKTIAGLTSITPVVPVDFTLTFVKLDTESKQDTTSNSASNNKSRNADKPLVL